jgi:tetrahydromethanopterin S-methyltransferase subunit G
MSKGLIIGIILGIVYPIVIAILLHYGLIELSCIDTNG